MESKRIEIIWDHDHGTANEGWYLRRVYTDREEDENLGNDAMALDHDASDANLIEKFIPLDEHDVPISVKR